MMQWFVRRSFAVMTNTRAPVTNHGLARPGADVMRAWRAALIAYSSAFESGVDASLSPRCSNTT